MFCLWAAAWLRVVNNFELDVKNFDEPASSDPDDMSPGAYRHVCKLVENTVLLCVAQTPSAMK